MANRAELEVARAPKSVRKSFDPQEWDRIYERAGPEGHVFRRTAELAAQAVRRVSKPGELWLDIGCGTGRLSAELAKEGIRVLSADCDGSMLRFARRFFLRYHSGLFYPLCTDAEDLSLRGASVDGLVAASLMGCLSNPAGFLREACRVLRPGGKAVLSFTNRRSVLFLLERLLLRERVQDTALIHGTEAYRLYTASEVQKEMAGIGFSVDRVVFYNFVLRGTRRLYPRENVARIFDSFAPKWGVGRLARNFLVVATAPAQGQTILRQQSRRSSIC